MSKPAGTAAEVTQVAAAYGEPIDTEPARAATFEVRGSAHRFSQLLIATVPKGRHLNKALQLVEMAYLVARQGIETNPPPA